MERCRRIAPITSLQPPYSAVSPEAEGAILPYCKEHGIGVIVYSPMKSGLLSGKMTRERVAAFPQDDFRRRAPAFQEPQLSRNLALADLMKKGSESQSFQTRLLRMLARAAMYLAAAAVPLVLWIAYLYLSYWGICNPACGWTDSYPHTPAWLLYLTHQVFNGTPLSLYFVLGAVLFLVQLILMPNANSLHRLYRDRLSRAFLFDPYKPEKITPMSSGVGGPASSRRPLDDLKLTGGLPEVIAAARRLIPA
jgi:hypothetical protein